LAGGSRSAVFAATDHHGRDLVLKLPTVRGDESDPAAAETAALSGWAATGAVVAVVDATPDALLLLRARPGTSWPWTPPGPLDDMVAIAADLLARIWASPNTTYSFPKLTTVYADRERVAREDAAIEQRERRQPDRGVPGLRRLPAAATAAEQLISTAREARLLHGDFITKNLVSDATRPSGWLAIDPWPVTGDPAAEAAAFAAYHPAELILLIAEGLARALDLDLRRVLRWSAIWSVHQAAQAWRQDQEQLEGLVASRLLNELLRD